MPMKNDKSIPMMLLSAPHLKRMLDIPVCEWLPCLTHACRRHVDGQVEIMNNKKGHTFDKGIY